MMVVVATVEVGPKYVVALLVGASDENHCRQQSHPSSCSCSEQDLETCRNEKKSCYICDFLFVYIYVFAFTFTDSGRLSG